MLEQVTPMDPVSACVKARRAGPHLVVDRSAEKNHVLIENFKIFMMMSFPITLYKIVF